MSREVGVGGADSRPSRNQLRDRNLSYLLALRCLARFSASYSLSHCAAAVAMHGPVIIGQRSDGEPASVEIARDHTVADLRKVTPYIESCKDASFDFGVRSVLHLKIGRHPPTERERVARDMPHGCLSVLLRQEGSWQALLKGNGAPDPGEPLVRDYLARSRRHACPRPRTAENLHGRPWGMARVASSSPATKGQLERHLG